MVKTRNIVHDDGRLEIRRVISADNLVDWEQDNPLAFERSIVWIRPVMDLPYVRTAFVKNARSRRGPLLTASEDQTVVGYSKLTADAPMQGLDYLYYQRRVFYLTSQDIDGVADVNASVNCIQPSTILPTIWGARKPFADPSAGRSGNNWRVASNSKVSGKFRDIREDSGIEEFVF
jgi:hypothetical protein